MSFILAALVFISTIVICFFMVFAAGMSDNPSAAEGVGGEAFGVLVIGCLISALLVGSHWLPHIGW